jgi:hypothetical protein
MIRDNLKINTSFENNSSETWSLYNGSTISVTNSDAYHGQYSLKVVKGASTSPGVLNTATHQIQLIVPGQYYTASAYFRVPTGQEAIDARVRIYFYEADGTSITSVDSATTTVTSASGWVRVSITYQAPALSARVTLLMMDFNTVTSGQHFLVDAIKFEQSSEPTQYVEQPIRPNLLPNPTFTSGTEGWSGYNSATLAIVTSASPYYYGYSAVNVTKSATQDTGIVSDLIKISGNTAYTASALVDVTSTEENVPVKSYLLWYGPDSVYISSNASEVTTALFNGTWVRTVVSGTAPSNAAYVKVAVVDSDATPTSGDFFRVDGIKLEQGSYPTEFSEATYLEDSPASHVQSHENTKVNNTLRKVPVPHITGMELSGDIMLNGLLLNTIDENDCVWVCTNIVGWWDLPDPEVPDMTRGLDDGSYDVRGRFTARNMTLEGSILVPDRSKVPVARAKLIEAINLVHIGGWLFVDEDPTKAAYVRLSGRPNIEVVNPRGRINFSVGLRAANPIKFKWNWNDDNGYESATVAAAGSTVFVNSGNIDVPVELSLEGPLTAPINIQNTTSSKNLKIVKDLRGTAFTANISNSAQADKIVILTLPSGHGFLVDDPINIQNVTTGGSPRININNDDGAIITAVTTTTITYTSATSRTIASGACDGNITLASKDTLVIDTYDKSALFRGSASIARSYIDAQVDWITLAPGNNTLTFTPTSGSTALTVKHRSGWIG